MDALTKPDNPSRWGRVLALETFRKVVDLLDPQERRRALLLFGMMLTTGILEAIGVVSVMPFFAVVSSPQVVHDDVYLKVLYNGLGFGSADAFLIFLGALVFVLVVGSLAFKALTQWGMARYVHMRSYSLSCRLLRNYLSRSYSFFLDHHSADLGKSVLVEVQQVITGVLLPSMQVVANVVVALCLFALVVSVETAVALIAMAVLGGFYALIYLFVRKYLRRIGCERMNANRERYKIAQEALGGIKEVKVLGLEDGYMRSFQKPALRFARSQAATQIVSQAPQFVLQGLAFGGMIAIVLVLLSAERGDVNSVLPVLALYAFAGMRILPALQQIYQGVTKLRYSGPVLEALHGDLQGGVSVSEDNGTPPGESPPAISLRHSLKLDRIRFSYPQADEAALKDLTLEVRANTTVGLVGATGGGKTTVVDVILGLLEPQEGELLVDGVSIKKENMRRWQRNVGYVPQGVFLIDDTVALNIAFGVPRNKVDMEAVERAARIAELHDFITKEMPRGYDALVGERGVRLSGGQRQRIGIARALYHDPDVLVFDEATSALDGITEKAVMDAVHNMAHRKTIILIAHRLSTVRACDRIFLLERGWIKASGTYGELLASSKEFRKLANV